jgi:hypothetical protein
MNATRAFLGKTKEEAKQKARDAIIKRVTQLYQQPPRLASRFPSICQIPLEQRIKRTTQQLQDWIHRIHHQIQVSELIHSKLPPGQLTLHQAYRNYGKNPLNRNKYPP